jgi:hypothetical protein
MGNVFSGKGGSKKSEKKDKDKTVEVKKVSKDAIFNKIIENISKLKAYDNDDTDEFETKQTRDLFLSIDDAFFSHKKLQEEITEILLKHGYLEITFKFLRYYAEEGFVGRKEINLAAANILNTIWSATTESFSFRKVCWSGDLLCL